MAALSLRVPEQFKTDIEELSAATGRSVSAILLEWCTKDLELERWQLDRVNEGIKAADDNLFIEDKQIKRALELCKS